MSRRRHQPQGPRFVSEADTDDASYLVALGCTVAFAGYSYGRYRPPMTATVRR